MRPKQTVSNVTKPWTLIQTLMLTCRCKNAPSNIVNFDGPLSLMSQLSFHFCTPDHLFISVCPPLTPCSTLPATTPFQPGTQWHFSSRLHIHTLGVCVRVCVCSGWEKVKPATTASLISLSHSFSPSLPRAHKPLKHL